MPSDVVSNKARLAQWQSGRNFLKRKYASIGHIDGFNWTPIYAHSSQRVNNVVLKLRANSISATEAFPTYSELICQLKGKTPQIYTTFCRRIAMHPGRK